MSRTFAGYGSTGVINTLLHWIAFAIFYSNGQLQALANYASFCIAETFSFFANACWTFNTEQEFNYIN